MTLWAKILREPTWRTTSQSSCLLRIKLSSLNVDLKIKWRISRQMTWVKNSIQAYLFCFDNLTCFFQTSKNSVKWQDSTYSKQNHNKLTQIQAYLGCFSEVYAILALEGDGARSKSKSWTPSSPKTPWLDIPEALAPATPGPPAPPAPPTHPERVPWWCVRSKMVTRFWNLWST